MKVLSTRALLSAATVVAAAAAVTTGIQILGGSNNASAAVSRPELGQQSGLLPRDHLTEESAIQVNLSKESVRLPLYKGDGRWEDRVVRPTRRIGPGDRARSRRQLRAEARQHRHRLPRPASRP